MNHFIRIVLVDDHKMVLQGMKALLEKEFQLMGELWEGDKVVPLAKKVQPDVILLDISLPPLGGFAIAEELKKRLPQMKIIFVTMHTEPTFIMKAFKVGGVGYVLKHNAASELVEAINTVMKNGYFLSKKIPEKVRDSVLSRVQGFPCHELQGKLTERQKEILELIPSGLTARQIGEQLGISHSTVAFHTSNIIQSLGLRNRAELTRYALDYVVSENRT